MANIEILSAEQLLSAANLDLGHSDWLTISQERINLFAESTGDHQWIHVDPERAAKGPFGTCIAHGYLSLSLVNMFLPQLVNVRNISMGVNYGCDKVRFPAVVPVGSKIRGQGQIIDAVNKGAFIQATIRVTIEIEGSERPACVVDTISCYTFETPSSNSTK
ncbi:MaoC domain protein dehydratase [Shewanella halifaxensis HAW-EB4]|uniref:MaoC domain protein dehydratase n=1 Tax=Shewanella halifaxensis (strain HAW-EB4) TaxID=458817 RepID=B0TTY1_SHEHH|nr:MaoC family dehydratase [Shewanella halifaxensis]ABZ76699.1 MaoC domain protein dehydratase [Shewanella halifaxensis HAW-EB4]